MDRGNDKVHVHRDTMLSNLTSATVGCATCATPSLGLTVSAPAATSGDCSDDFSGLIAVNYRAADVADRVMQSYCMTAGKSKEGQSELARCDGRSLDAEVKCKHCEITEVKTLNT